MSNDGCVRVLDDSPELEEIWDRVAAGCGSQLQQFAWVQACAASFGESGPVRVLASGPPKRPTALAALVGRGTPRRLELVGVRELFEPSDFLYLDRAALLPLVRALATQGSALFLERLPARSHTVAAVRQAFRGRGVVVRRQSVGHPYVRLDDGAPDSRLAATHQADLRRARRIAQRSGAVACEILSPSPADLAPALDEALRVEAAGWKGRRGTALLHDGPRGGFYRRYAQAAARMGILRIAFLRIGGRAASMQIAVEWAERYWLLKIGYDEEFARCSPGSLLLQDVARSTAERGLRSFELLGCATPWTRRWTREVRPCVSVLAYPFGLGGVAHLAGDATRLLVRRVGGLFRRQGLENEPERRDARDR